MENKKQSLEEAAWEYADHNFGGPQFAQKTFAFQAGAVWTKKHDPDVRALVEALRQIAGWPVQPGMSEHARKALAAFEESES